MESIKNIIKKILTKEIILYGIFGILTTIINLASFYVMNSLWHWDKNIANIFAIILAVLVAYITNKDLVFHSSATNIKEKLQELFKFILGRVFTMLIEFFGGLLLFQTALPIMISKCLVTVIVIILNFFISKFFAFKNNKSI